MHSNWFGKKMDDYSILYAQLCSFLKVLNRKFHFFPGPMTYIRTCSTNLDVRMPIAHVCMLESRPGDGHLCFCGRDLCNYSNSIHRSKSNSLIMMLLLMAIASILAGRFLTRTHWGGETLLMSTPFQSDASSLPVTTLSEGTTVFTKYRRKDIKDSNTGWFALPCGSMCPFQISLPWISGFTHEAMWYRRKIVLGMLSEVWVANGTTGDR